MKELYKNGSFIDYSVLISTVFDHVIFYNTIAAAVNRKESKMEDVYIILERHEQTLKSLTKDMTDLRQVQSEIRAMNETLVTLATELKHTNEHLARHERKIEDMENQPRNRLQQIVTALISALCGGLISLVIGLVFA